jgi:hypothetical protein
MAQDLPLPLVALISVCFVVSGAGTLRVFFFFVVAF